MSDQQIMIILLIKDHHRLKHWKFQVQIKKILHHVRVNKEKMSDMIVLYRKYASIPNGAVY